MEKEPHQGKRGIVKNGADRPDEDHEPLDVVDIPFQGFYDQFLIHIVRGDSGLREVIKQIVRQDLNRLHGQKRNEITGTDHAEHIPEIGTGTHADVFDDIGKDPPAFQDALLQNQEVFFLIITDLGGSFCILPKKLISSGYAANFHDNETCSVFQQDFENFDT